VLIEISRSSFWDRLANKKLQDFIEKAVLKFSFHIQGKALSKLSWLSSFNDVFIYDASPIRLPAGLTNIFPGNRKNHSPACLKLSALYRLSFFSISSGLRKMYFKKRYVGKKFYGKFANHATTARVP